MSIKMSFRPRSASTLQEDNLKSKSERELSYAKDPVERLRLLCLSRGAGGILGLGKVFRRMDDDNSHSISEEEFLKGIRETGLKASEDDGKELFKAFDADGTGTIDYNEFIKTIRPHMNEARKKLVEMVFEKLDSSGDGIVTMEDLENVYSVARHPKYISGEMSKEQILKSFIGKFEGNTTKDGKLTKDEFIDYYSGVSASIDQDGFFDLMMRNAWDIK